MKYMKLAFVLSMLFAAAASAETLEDLKTYMAQSKGAMMSCLVVKSEQQKTICLNSLNLIRLQKQTNPWQEPGVKISLNASELAVTMNLSQIYLLEKNTQLFCDYAHTAGLLHRDMMTGTQALIDSDPVAAEKMAPHVTNMRSLEKTLQTYKLTCLNERLPFGPR